LAAARRTAAKALSAKREAAVVRETRAVVKYRSRRQVLKAERHVKVSEKAALAHAKQVSALALKADPSSCLKRSGVLAASHAASRSKSKSDAMRVRDLILKCLDTARVADQKLRSESMANSKGAQR
jgi:hypothetical protein